MTDTITPTSGKIFNEYNVIQQQPSLFEIIIINKSQENSKVKVQAPIRVYDLYVTYPQLFEQHKDHLFPVGVYINNNLHSLSDIISQNSIIQMIYSDTIIGSNIYRQSLVFLFSKVFHQLYPENHLEISHSTGHAFYFTVRDDNSVDVTQTVCLSSKINTLIVENKSQENSEQCNDNVNTISLEMQNQISQNLPIISHKPTCLSHAIKQFKKQHFTATVNLLQSINEIRIFTSQCEDYLQLYQTPLVATTGILTTYNVIVESNYIVLQFPSHNSPQKIEQYQKNQAITNLYANYNQWSQQMQVQDIGQLNLLNRSQKFKPYVQICEARSNQMIQKICDQILSGKKSINGVIAITDIESNSSISKDIVIGKAEKTNNNIKLVQISGPSSSGKTTFAQKLQYLLSVHGRQPLVLSMDNYFVDREKTPLDHNGNYDFEHINAIDLDLFNQQLSDLLNGKMIKSPIFDFKAGMRLDKHKELILPQNGIVIIEGIHALNPQITKLIPKNEKFGIFIQPLPQLNLDDVTRISTNDYRLIRRIVRDNKFRGFSAEQTISLFKNVRKGEEQWVYPNSKRADVYFNTALDYELPVLETFVTPLLNQISPDSPVYSEARRLIGVLNQIQGKNSDGIASTSFVREFIGQSAFEY